MRKIRLCRIIYEFSPSIGGSITHTIDLAKHMASHCEHQFIIVPKIKTDTSKLDASFPFKVHRVKYYEFIWLQLIKSKYIKWLPVAPLIICSFSLSAIKKCMWLNYKYGLDIIHAHGIGLGPAVTILRFLIKVPAVLMLDGSLESYSLFSGYYESLLFRITKLDHYFVVDNGGPALPKFKKLISNKSKITPVFINIDINTFYPKQKNLELIKHLRLTNKFIYISIHNLNITQGVEYSIKGFKKLIDEFDVTNVILLIVGGGELREKLEIMVKDLNIDNKVIFIGSVKNSLVPEYYSISDVALSTSTKINMNTSTIEAMACKVPVIAFDCGNTSDILLRNLENGILVRSGSTDNLAKAMFLLYNDIELLQKLGENARNFVFRERKWDKRVASELAVYRKILKISYENNR